MNEAEGVIRFQLEFRHGAAPEWGRLRDLNAWRKILYMTGLIGQRPDLYEGYAYGNASIRVAAGSGQNQDSFIICGTQTGGIPDLTAEHYTTVLSCRTNENKVLAQGPVKPSSEAMTHGMIYQQDAGIGCVLHAHSSSIWRHAAGLGIPATDAGVPYGTPQMANAVKALFQDTDVAEQRILVMGGHQDGVVSFGADPCVAGTVMIATLARALSRD